MLYHVTFLRWKGATLGKLVCRLRVVPVDRGRDPGTAGAGTRWASAPRSGCSRGSARCSRLFTVVDALFPLWHPKRQALHDLAAKTQVVKRA